MPILLIVPCLCYSCLFHSVLLQLLYLRVPLLAIAGCCSRGGMCVVIGGSLRYFVLLQSYFTCPSWACFLDCGTSCQYFSGLTARSCDYEWSLHWAVQLMITVRGGYRLFNDKCGRYVDTMTQRQSEVSMFKIRVCFLHINKNILAMRQKDTPCHHSMTS